MTLHVFVDFITLLIYKMCYFMCLIVVNFILILTEQISCPSGYALIKGNCYKFNKNKQGWNDAVHHCASDSATLLSLDSKSMYDEITKAIKNGPSKLAIEITL